MFSVMATKFCEIFTLLLTLWTAVKSKVKILQNFVAFTEYIYEIYQDNLMVIFDQWPKLHLSLDALSNQKILNGI